MKQTLRRVLAASVLFALIIFPFVIWGEWLEALAPEIAKSQEATAGVFLAVVALLASDIVLPIPSSIVAYLSGQLLGFWLGALANFLGLTLGCVVGYWLGYFLGKPAFQMLLTRKDLDKLDVHFRSFGSYSVILLRGIPIFAEASVLLAGTTRFGLSQFLKLATPVNAILGGAFAYGGSLGVATSSGIATLCISVAIPSLVLFYFERARRPY